MMMINDDDDAAKRRKGVLPLMQCCENFNVARLRNCNKVINEIFSGPHHRSAWLGSA